MLQYICCNKNVAYTLLFKHLAIVSNFKDTYDITIDFYSNICGSLTLYFNSQMYQFSQ